MTLLGLGVAAVTRPAHVDPVLPTMTPLVVSATGGGSLTPLRHSHAGHAVIPSLTPKIVSAAGGGSITPLPSVAQTGSAGDRGSSSAWPVATPIAAAALMVAWMVTSRRRRRRPAVDVSLG